MRITLIALVALLMGAGAASAQFNPEAQVARRLVADQGLFFALAEGDVAAMGAMRDQGADPNATLARTGLKPKDVFDSAEPIFSQPFNTSGWPILTWAVYRNDPEAVNLLLRAGARVNAPDEYGATALHWAAWAGRLDLAKLLLNNGASCGAKDFKGRTAKDWAVMFKRIDVIKLIDSRGCRPAVGDEDRDGVPDQLDQCPGTPLGAPVDDRGCWVVAYAAFFDFDRSVIKTEFLPHVQQAARILANNPDIVVTLVGHTDDKGSDAYNYGLGLRRAQAVRRELERNGVSPSRLLEDSMGETQPIADNATGSGRARNRRVEINVAQPPAGAAAD
jgi:hypothetical protein